MPLAVTELFAKSINSFVYCNYFQIFVFCDTNGVALMILRINRSSEGREGSECVSMLLKESGFLLVQGAYITHTLQNKNIFHKNVVLFV